MNMRQALVGGQSDFAHGLFFCGKCQAVVEVA